MVNAIKFTDFFPPTFVFLELLRWLSPVTLLEVNSNQVNFLSKSRRSANAFELKRQICKRKKEFIESTSSPRLKCFPCADQPNLRRFSKNLKKLKWICLKTLVFTSNCWTCRHLSSVLQPTESLTLKRGCQVGICGARYQVAAIVPITNQED